MRVPTMSAGTRSGVNWMRANVPPTTRASVSTASVLATPGTPSSRQCPRASSATNIRSTIRSWPTMTRLTSNIARSSTLASCAGVEPVETEWVGAAFVGLEPVDIEPAAVGLVGGPSTAPDVVGSVTPSLHYCHHAQLPSRNDRTKRPTIHLRMAYRRPTHRFSPTPQAGRTRNDRRRIAERPQVRAARTEPLHRKRSNEL